MRGSFGVLVAFSLTAAAACGDDFEPYAGDEPDSGGGNAGAATGGAAGNDASAGTGGSGGSDAAKSCDHIDDCGDPATLVCDPDTATCAPVQCSPTKECASSEVCVVQSNEPIVGACYPKCTLGGPACANGATCFPYLGEGACISAGTAVPGEPCEAFPGHVKSDCAEGYWCDTDETGAGTTCVQICDPWGTTVTCSAGQCHLGLCTSDGDSAAIGSTCSAGNDLKPCGADGQRWQGVCLSDGVNLNCIKLCRMSEPADCTSPQVCVQPGPFGEQGYCN